MLKYIFFCAALFWTGVVLFFCLENANNLPTINIPNLDKVIHTFFHFVFTTLWFLFFKKKIDSPNNIKLLIASVVFSFFFGIMIELIQQFFTVTRTADVLDVVANLFGALLAAGAIFFLNKFNGIIDKI